MLLTKTELDELAAAGCSEPGCTHSHDGEPLRLVGKCHQQGNDVEYEYGSSILVIRCRVCGKLVAMVSVTNWVSVTADEAMEVAERSQPLSTKGKANAHERKQINGLLSDVLQRRFPK
jgi:phage FluMu protein Com